MTATRFDSVFSTHRVQKHVLSVLESNLEKLIEVADMGHVTRPSYENSFVYGQLSVTQETKELSLVAHGVVGKMDKIPLLGNRLCYDGKRFLSWGYDLKKNNPEMLIVWDDGTRHYPLKSGHFLEDGWRVPFDANILPPDISTNGSIIQVRAVGLPLMLDNVPIYRGKVDAWGARQLASHSSGVDHDILFAPIEKIRLIYKHDNDSSSRWVINAERFVRAIPYWQITKLKRS